VFDARLTGREQVFLSADHDGLAPPPDRKVAAPNMGQLVAEDAGQRLRREALLKALGQKHHRMARAKNAGAFHIWRYAEQDCIRHFQRSELSLDDLLHGLVRKGKMPGNSARVAQVLPHHDGKGRNGNPRPTQHGKCWESWTQTGRRFI
jgi:hypothetical protein